MSLLKFQSLIDRTIDKSAADEVKGIPSRQNLGDLSKLTPGELIDWIIQYHEAQRSGPHYDVRFGTPDTGLYSWATKHELPEPGQRRALFQQPVHRFGYGEFEGVIPKGYGAGTVRRKDKGKVLVTNVEPGKIEFVTAHKRYPERFALIKPEKWKEKDWLLINTTPREPVPYEKIRYKKIPADQVDQAIENMQEGETLERKYDGASTLLKLMKNGVELTSYRTSKTTGRPIIQTERFFGGKGKADIPPELEGTVLKGEIYGERGEDGEVIPPQELGGVLNASVAEALRKQRERNIKLRLMAYDIQQLGKEHIDWHEVPRSERRKMIERVLQYLPEDKFHISEAATTPEEARELWNRIKERGYSPATEGVVYHPLHGKPWKSKLLEDSDVYVRGIFPGAGKYHGGAAGGFEYSLDPEGEIVGRVGTGFSDETRREMWQDPEAFKGRVARIQSQHQHPSGAWRSPAFLAWHEDYPTTAKLAAVDMLGEARKKVDTNPTEAQQEAGNYRKGHVNIHGLDITIENPKGSTRSGTDPSGKKWSVKMRHDYGYFKRSEGKDGDHVDVFVGENPDSELAFIVNQHEPGGGSFDEHKCVIGVKSESEARETYLSSYEDGWDGLKSIIPTTIPQLKQWLTSGNTSKPATAETLTTKKVSHVFSCCGKVECDGCSGPSQLIEPEWYALKWAAEKNKVVAVDLDGTLAEHYGEGEFDEGSIPKPRSGAKTQMERLRDAGAVIIINTCRGQTDVVKSWLEEHKIPYDHINRNPEQPEGTSDKVMADVYMDDRAIDASRSLAAATTKAIGRLKKSTLAELHDSINVNRISTPADGEKTAIVAEQSEGDSFNVNRISTPADGEKVSTAPSRPAYWRQGMYAQLAQPTWKPREGVLQNIAANLQQAEEKGRQKVKDEDFKQDLLSELQPGFALNRFQRYIRSGDHVQDPLDKALYRNQLPFPL